MSSPRSELSAKRAVKDVIVFAEQIEIFQVKSWLVTFKARDANLKSLDDRRKKEKKTARSTVI